MVYSLFPTLFSFTLVAATLLRVTLGVYTLMLGYRTLRAVQHPDAPSGGRHLAGSFLGVLEYVLGALLILGLYTQGAAIGVMGLMPLLVYGLRRTSVPQHTQPLFILLGIVATSVLVLGPGLFALDLPL